MRNTRRTTVILIILLLVTNVMNNGLSDPKTYFYNMLVALPGIIIGLSFHEFGHAFVSDRLGDPTPRMQGRVTINPRAHFDPFGFLALVFCGFGWGVPVQIDPRYYKKPRRDEFLVSVAGVLMNLLIAVIFSVIIHFMYSNLAFSVLEPGTVLGTVFNILLQIVIVNVVLFVFNLIPVPPLDGFGIITQIFNLRTKGFYEKLYNSGYMILMFMLLFGLIEWILNPIVNGIYSMLLRFIIL